MLELHLLGSGEATYLDHPLPGFPHKKCYLLLCYLVLNRHTTHSREQLATRFWGDHSAAVSRKYLRNAYWQLRTALQAIGVPVDQYLSGDDERLAFVSTSSYWLDIEIMQSILNRHDNLLGEHLTTEQAKELEEAVSLYQGDLLEGVYEDWCLHEREWLRKLLLSSLNKLMDFYEANQNYEQALVYGRRILVYDNVHERIHRRMMRLYCKLGNRAAALLQYQQCVEILRQELDVPPMPETEELYRQIISNEITHDRRAIKSNPALPIPALSDQELTRHALQCLQQLKTVLQEANRELNRLETLFNRLVSYDDEAS